MAREPVVLKMELEADEAKALEVGLWVGGVVFLALSAWAYFAIHDKIEPLLGTVLPNWVGWSTGLAEIPVMVLGLGCLFAAFGLHRHRLK